LLQQSFEQGVEGRAGAFLSRGEMAELLETLENAPGLEEEDVQCSDGQRGQRGIGVRAHAAAGLLLFDLCDQQGEILVQDAGHTARGPGPYRRRTPRAGSTERNPDPRTSGRGAAPRSRAGVRRRHRSRPFRLSNSAPERFAGRADGRQVERLFVREMMEDVGLRAAHGFGDVVDGHSVEALHGEQASGPMRRMRWRTFRPGVQV